jgi:hypothetical protein
MNKGYYKKVDRSMMDWGFTIPKDFVDDFLCGQPLSVGSSRDIKLVWNKNEETVKLSHINRKAGRVYQIRWDNNKRFLNKLRQVFIQSYIILKSQKELFDKTNTDNKHFRTMLDGGKQEVIIFYPVSPTEIKVKEFIVIDNEWNTLFRRLVSENVFGWIFDKKDKEYLIQKSTNWIDVSEFNNHKNADNVIYYLAKTTDKLLYIGKAENLGKRVKPGNKHQNMPGDWNKFKYDIVRPEFANILERIEDHTIRTVASILKNNKKYSSLNIGDYTLVNDRWKKL